MERKSELSKTVTEELFNKAFIKFLEQADQNAETKKAQGTKVPFGFNQKPLCDGAEFLLHYGQGAASATPYMNWWVVSIYYLPAEGNIMIGIESNRYPYLSQMQIDPIATTKIGNKKTSVAVFYSTTKSSIDYGALHERFMDVCEEVMRLGLK